jgi:hypothetical protein
MAEVFAGFLCGYVSALVLTPVLALALLKMRSTSDLLSRLLPPGTPAVGLMVILHTGMAMLWTAAGLLLGLVLMAMNSGHQVQFLLSRNVAFSFFVAGLTLATVAPIALVSKRYRRSALVGASLVVLLFGWLMPYVAAWSSFD